MLPAANDNKDLSFNVNCKALFQGLATGYFAGVTNQVSR
jgi:hypothetical protein